MKPASLHTSTEISQEAEINLVKDSILKTLAYFDIFQYPLTAEEVRQFLERRSTEVIIHEALTRLLKEQRIYLSNGFFSLTDNPLLGPRRKKGNERADVLIKKANSIGKFLFRFPFVRAIGISGSLSKNFATENADIDFFIITKSNRLWIARTLMHLFKKFTFITGKQHYYCMNYYVDEEMLFFEEQNIFTAIEIKTLIPVSGRQVMELFFEKNSWTDDWFPGFHFKKQERKDPKTWFKKVFEWLFNGKTGDAVERFLCTLTQKRWQKKLKKQKKNIKGETMGFISGKHFAMSNPGNFRERILQSYNEKLAGLKISSRRGFNFTIIR